jgi:hypothetical protein
MSEPTSETEKTPIGPMVLVGGGGVVIEAQEILKVIADGNGTEVKPA